MPTDIEEIIGTVTSGAEPETESKPSADVTVLDPLNDAFPDDAAILAEEKKAKRERGELPDDPSGASEADTASVKAESAESKPDGGLKLDEQLVHYAVNLGLPLSVARSFGSTQALEQELFFRAQAQQRLNGPAQQPQPQTPVAEEEDFDLAAALGDDLDPKIKETLVKAFDKQKQTQAKLNEQLATINQSVAQQKVADQQRALQAQAVEFDDFIASQPEVYHDPAIFGKGRERELDKNSEAYRNRAEAFALALDMENAMLLRGNRNIDRRQLMDKATWAVAGKKLHEAQKRRTTEKLSKAEKTFTNPPAGRSNAAVPTELRAKLDQMMRGWNKDPRTGDDL